jgi:cysteine-rich repeat protein
LGESCDDGNASDEDGCSSMCQTEYCGDGMAQYALGETCDDGNNSDGDGCDGLCQASAPVIIQ